MAKLIHHVLNWPGWRSKRKFLVIESDDWGSIRMPRGSNYDCLVKKGIVDLADPYSSFDTLEDAEDLHELFSVLSSIRGSSGNPAIVTANTIVANPDFASIRSSRFCSYFFQEFNKSYSQRDGNESCMMAWKSGIEERLIKPQLHGREHVNVHQWLASLRNGHQQIRAAFDHETFAVPHREQFANRGNYMATYDFSAGEDDTYIMESLTSAVEIFERSFGFRPRSFIAPCYLWSSKVEKALSQVGVRFIQGIYFQYISNLGKSDYSRRLHFLGERNEFGQVYLTRNSFFEPSLTKSADDEVVGACLKRIGIAFMWNKPAIVGAHRLNFMGGLSVGNRERSLRLLKLLLRAVVRKWPDVEFLSSDQLGELILNGE